MQKENITGQNTDLHKGMKVTRNDNYKGKYLKCYFLLNLYKRSLTINNDNNIVLQI